ncbi:hypothetical protein K438DRAFT_1760757 [Mycena galopus ATCC 62051]|nr:hypothetical protein K438DRAFT_1760757 [Mycena galopus ATCC 62051]
MSLHATTSEDIDIDIETFDAWMHSGKPDGPGVEVPFSSMRLCFAGCGQLATCENTFPGPIGKQVLCKACGAQPGLLSLDEFWDEHQGTSSEWRDTSAKEYCPGEATVLLMLQSVQRITPTLGVIPRRRAHSELNRDVPKSRVIQGGGERPVNGMVDGLIKDGIELYRAGVKNGLTLPEVTWRIKDELLDRPSQLRADCAYPPTIHREYGKRFDEQASQEASDRSTWKLKTHKTIHTHACEGTTSVDEHHQKHKNKKIESVLTGEKFRLQKGKANHSLHSAPFFRRSRAKRSFKSSASKDLRGSIRSAVRPFNSNFRGIDQHSHFQTTSCTGCRTTFMQSLGTQNGPAWFPGLLLGKGNNWGNSTTHDYWTLGFAVSLASYKPEMRAEGVFPGMYFLRDSHRGAPLADDCSLPLYVPPRFPGPSNATSRLSHHQLLSNPARPVVLLILRGTNVWTSVLRITFASDSTSSCERVIRLATDIVSCVPVMDAAADGVKNGFEKLLRSREKLCSRKVLDLHPPCGEAKSMSSRSRWRGMAPLG